MTIEKVCEKCGEINLLDFETIKKKGCMMNLKHRF